jgi:hypothetical protein
MHKHSSKYNIGEIVCYDNSGPSINFSYAKILAIKIDDCNKVHYKMSDNPQVRNVNGYEDYWIPEKAVRAKYSEVTAEVG